MRRRKARRDGRTFRPERFGGALRAELKQNIKQFMDEQFVHEFRFGLGRIRVLFIEWRAATALRISISCVHVFPH
jgi:hypothetical protein